MGGRPDEVRLDHVVRRLLAGSHGDGRSAEVEAALRQSPPPATVYQSAEQLARLHAQILHSSPQRRPLDGNHLNYQIKNYSMVKK